MLSQFLLLADEKAQQEQPQSPWTSFIWLLPIVVLGYFLLIRPMRRQERQRQLLVNSLKKNDKVITSSGIIGTVVAVAEKEDEVTIKVDDNVRLKMLKSAIARNVSAEEALKDPKATTTESNKT